MSFSHPLFPGFYDPWNALWGCRNSRWLTGAAPNTSFLSLSPCFFPCAPETGLRGAFLQKAARLCCSYSHSASCVCERPRRFKPCIHPPHCCCFLKRLSNSANALWKQAERERKTWLHRKALPLVGNSPKEHGGRRKLMASDSPVTGNLIMWQTHKAGAGFQREHKYWITIFKHPRAYLSCLPFLYKVGLCSNFDKPCNPWLLKQLFFAFHESWR